VRAQALAGQAAKGAVQAGARSRAPLIIAMLFMLPAVLPLLAPGYFFNAHDAHHSVFWLVEFDQTLRDGALWPIWAPDHALGFGYPLWLVYAPLAYTVAEVFHLLGLGFTDAIKATWLLGFIIGGLGTYRLARRWWGPAAALLAALAYTYAPYHLVQIYVRADLAEFMAWAWFPWAWLALAALWDDPRPRRAALAALALGLLLVIHTVSILIFPFVLAGFVLLKLLQRWRRQRWLPVRPLAWTAVAAVTGGLLGLGFLLPGLAEIRYLVQSQWTPANYVYSQQFVYLNQFLGPFWGFGHAFPGPNDGMSFQVGLLPFLGGIAGALGILAAYRRTGGAKRDAGDEVGSGGLPGGRVPRRAEGAFLVVLTLAGIFMMTGASLPVWQLLPFGNLIQFPWRLLALTMVTLALLTGAGACWLEGATLRLPGPYVYVAALLIVLAGYPYLQPDLQPVRPEDESPLAVIAFEQAHPDMRGGTVWASRPPADADSPLLAQYLAGQPLQRAAIISGSGAILDQTAHAAASSATVKAETDLDLRFYIYYFPGWRATIDGQPVAIGPQGPNGLIGLAVPPGQHEVSVWFGSTPIRDFAAALSLAGFALCGLLFLLDFRMRREAAGR
jgi:hypothetical protein